MDERRLKFIAYQKSRRESLVALLGDLPLSKGEPPRLVRKEQHNGYTLEYLDFDFNGIERVPGILLIPDRIEGKSPCMLYCHAHFGTYNIGKEELLIGRDVMPAYAPVLADKGIVTLAIDS